MLLPSKERVIFSPAKDLFPNQVVFESMNVTSSCFQSSKQVICQSCRHVRANHRVWSHLGGKALHKWKKWSA